VAYSRSVRKGAAVLSSQAVKARRDVREWRFLLVTTAAVVALLAVFSLYIWARLTVVSLGYEISSAEAERKTLVERNSRLKVEYARLRSPERIERIATKRLGLVHPGPGQVVRVR